jgi:hypothetical protein
MSEHEQAHMGTLANIRYWVFGSLRDRDARSWSMGGAYGGDNLHSLTNKHERQGERQDERERRTLLGWPLWGGRSEQATIAGPTGNPTVDRRQCDPKRPETDRTLLRQPER